LAKVAADDGILPHSARPGEALTRMRILSLHAAGHDSAAAIFRDYELLAAVQQERLTRRKGDGGLPLAAVDEVLTIAGLARRDIDALVLTRAHYPVRFFTRLGPYKYLEDSVNRAFGKCRNKDVVLEMIRRGAADANEVFDAERMLAHLGLRPGTPVFFSNHHLAHALSALFHTDWDDALVYTADGCGDNVHYSHRVLRDGALTCLFGDDRWLAVKRRVDSLGLAYGYATQALGYRMNRHEGKLTGLAAFGRPAVAAQIASHFTVDEEGLIDSDFASDRAMRETLVALAETCEPADLAASIQQVLEDVIGGSISRLLQRHGVRRLALAGGVFANVRLNRLLCEQTGVDEVFIFPAMGDEGLVVGGALQLLLERDGLAAWLARRRRLTDVYWGRDYNGAIDRRLGDHPAVRGEAGDPAARTVELLRGGRVGAVYGGRMEFGPRALGARSILASPADAAVNATLNTRLARSEFMPFAPYVLAEDAAEVFEVTAANRYACRFMTITTAVRPEWRERIPAVVHIDGTARPQIIDPAVNPLYARILAGFKAATGLPVLVNTSFNVHEEPIVNTPDDCLKALLDDRIDFVVTRNRVYRRAD
jgi:carbamoyltransferase